jgi:GMP synthase (glutamine-hydrolysing)
MSAIHYKIKCIQLRIQREVGKNKAIVAVSGGIDSSVCAVLSAKAISKQLFPVFIRTGFTLDKEENQLLKLFNKFGINVKILSKEKEYFKKLKNIEDPNKRRYQFGKLSLELLKAYARDVGVNVLINGVNKNDKFVLNTSISYKKRAQDTKRVLGLKLVEPIAELYKNEIRGISKKIGLGEIAFKQHIPGPALAIRISGKITKEKLALLKQVNQLVDSRINNNYWQFFPFLLNEKLDNKFIVVLRAVVSKDGGLTAEVKYDPKLLNKIAKEILKSYTKVGRVLFDISPKPPITIEFM